MSDNFLGVATSVTGGRLSAGERREAVLAAAMREFADKGFHGASTDDIARAAGISQPYLFRLFGTKKSLYLETARRAMGETVTRMANAANGLTGRAALAAMGEAYRELLEDRTRLKLMMQCFGSCDDPDVRASVRATWEELTALVERVSGEGPGIVSHFFANGMLLNVMMAMQLFDDRTPWGDRLAEGCASWLD